MTDESRRPLQDAAPFPIVGIGASAGGLAALKSFFQNVPEKPGMAFVVVLHLSPDRQSHLAEIISRWSKMPVHEITGDMKMKNGCVYIIAPDQALVVEDTCLRVEPAGPPPRHPVDTLFESLAAARGNRAVGVILSGSGSNGSAGALEIKDKGGVVFVQDPETAEYDGMPRAAISTGVIDRVLAPGDIPGELIEYVSHLDTVEAPVEDADVKSRLMPILTLMRERLGSDFRSYKAGTLMRRIQRRMGLRHLRTLEGYLEVLHDDRAEMQTLARDLLINVTAFFRDEEAWEALRETVIRPLVRARDSEQTIRAWTPGCSSGEEAYSLAMLLLEEVEAADRALEVKVFATDPAPDVLNRARTGRFPATVAESISEKRLRTYFDRDGDGYVARKRLRDAIVFAPQNLLSDPPFSHLDIVCCRNLLIYLEPEAQRHVLAMLHFALRPDGVLFLGPSETGAERDTLFETIVRKWRIYRRKNTARAQLPSFSPVGGHGFHQQLRPHHATPPPGPTDAERTRDALVESFAPPSVLIDRDYTILYYQGATNLFLGQPEGEPTQNLLRLAHPALVQHLRGTIGRALSEGKTARLDLAPSGGGGGEGGADQRVEIWARPLWRREGGDIDRVLVSVVPPAVASAPPVLPRLIPEDDENELEAALRVSQDDLRRTIAELERSNEDLKASNEEISSINEEFQAANEELETSKEELQSLNEELNTVNSQLQDKVSELEERTNDLNNTLNSSAIITLFLDSALRIRWFSPASRDLFPLTGTDLGRSVTDFAQQFDDPSFLDDMRAVPRDLTPRENEVKGPDGRWFLRRALPYRTEDDRIAGVVVTFIDITARRRAEQALAHSERRFRALVEASAQMVWTTDANGVVVEDSASWRAFTGQTREEWLGQGWTEAVHPDDRERTLAEWRRSISRREMFSTEFRLWHAASGKWHHTAVRAVPLHDDEGAGEGGRVREWVGMNIDITEQHDADAHRQLLLDELQHRVKNLFSNIGALLRLSSREARDVTSFVEGFGQRLAALERTQNLLGVQSADDADLRELVVSELNAHGAAPGDRVRLDGGRLRLPQRTAQVMGMIVHELCTNARKYGALKEQEGVLEIAWTVLDEHQPRLVLSWTERGVTMPETKPTPGFGMRLVQRVAPYMLGGTVSLEFPAGGVRCVVDVPLAGGHPAGVTQDNEEATTSAEEG